MNDWHYGRLDTVSAILANDRLIVRVDGVQPDPCFDVMLSAYAPDPDSTADVQLGLYWRLHSEAGDGAPTPYTVRAEIDVGGAGARVVRVYHASGYVDLTIHGRASGTSIHIAAPPG